MDGTIKVALNVIKSKSSYNEIQFYTIGFIGQHCKIIRCRPCKTVDAITVSVAVFHILFHHHPPQPPPHRLLFKFVHIQLPLPSDTMSAVSFCGGGDVCRTR